MRPITTNFITSFCKKWGDIIKLCTKLIKFKNRNLSFLEKKDDNQIGKWDNAKGTREEETQIFSSNYEYLSFFLFLYFAHTYMST